MFARFNNPRFNLFLPNENTNDSDSIHGKDFTVIVPTIRPYTETGG
jgi:hypothetical protein